ncbi:MAG: UDP-N-acetylglucosamine--N-acetylmuramyl-(pentapeptide) pyrophosphoryl-undecaprenol N-acetylglucosamine transferase [Candidatus Omnitrophica bacterium]|nr:UDP-N-acetylglucosamine--N-acetylmuramyl-(pentapeptide) pyrophosphoryl-undecaprenol N-acetylglucosamine transferase [Candidatus Omnitrophota bacterium]MBU2044839.1 UDP-N-acetylglucosamine--N-acetylmuramyl-(pentapeptide) pyrophosphoryl-undecaprenol N-acetylglucosamine transferase [Candidatus Omnitrophota bacterium]MBU2473646.1 UDP-N-acetylglucosamine--N-acetylmuramyl-(pentapeptide) pyrophosphoryl-undecaprenol N-acetylglucosamine transferase [Candidatus Omnitrophota bacterium]
MRILFACERSAGHTFPALAVAQKISSVAQGTDSQDNFAIYFFVTSKNLKQYVKKEGYLTLGKHLPCRCLIVEGILRFFEAVWILLRLRPEKVIGFGGRDSFFLILLSKLFFIKTVLYEPNVALGRANKLLIRFVPKVLQGFPGKQFCAKSLVVGVPLRKSLTKLDKPAARKILNFDQTPVIFCCGGSQGARFLNQVFLRFIEKFNRQCQVIHLTGQDKYFEIYQNYNKITHKSFVKDFYYNVEILYSAADIVVSRAGALTLSEISYYGLAALLIPHPAGFGHQMKNALYFQEKGAALVCPEKDFSYSDFSSSLERLVSDCDFRKNLADQAGKINLGVGFEDLDITPFY